MTGPLATRAGFSNGVRTFNNAEMTPFSQKKAFVPNTSFGLHTPHTQFMGQITDPFAGASMSLHPEELDRLDITQMENGAIDTIHNAESYDPNQPNAYNPNLLDESLSLQLSKERFKMLENSIHGTISALNGEDPYYKATLEMMNPVLNPISSHTRHNAFGGINNAHFTPPPSATEKNMYVQSDDLHSNQILDHPVSGNFYDNRSTNTMTSPHLHSQQHVNHSNLPSIQNKISTQNINSPHPMSNNEHVMSFPESIGNHHPSTQVNTNSQNQVYRLYNSTHQGGFTRSHGEIENENNKFTHPTFNSKTHMYNNSTPLQDITNGFQNTINHNHSHQKSIKNTPSNVHSPRLNENHCNIHSICNRRPEETRQVESERIRQIEDDYRKQLSALQHDLERMLRQHEQVIKLKNEVESGLQSQLDSTKRDVNREKRGREADREKYTRILKDMRDKIRSLESTIERISNSRITNFSTDQSSNNSDSIAEVKRQSDAKIASLAKHFEREKSATIEVLKARFRAEVGLLVPKIKDRLQMAYKQRLESIQDSISNSLRHEYDARIKRINDEHTLERKILARQMREQVEQERKQVAEKLRQKYELRMMDVRNECERRILDRLRQNNVEIRDRLDY